MVRIKKHFKSDYSIMGVVHTLSKTNDKLVMIDKHKENWRGEGCLSSFLFPFFKIMVMFKDGSMAVVKG